MVGRTERRFPMCIASNCMGWRYVQLDIAATFSPVTGKKITEAVPGKGHCGFVGR